MFEFLFKYSPIVFRDGLISARNIPQYTLVIALLLLICLLFVFIAYRNTRAPISIGLKSGLLFLRYFILFALLYILIEPVITISEVVPKKSAVMLLVDSSKSMQIQDAAENQSRTDAVKNYLWGDKDNIISRLQENFHVLTYSFNSEISALDSGHALQNSGELTDFANALSFAVTRTKSQPVSAVVLVSDGSVVQREKETVTQENDPLKLAAFLGQKNIPLFTVGVGSPIESDVRLVSVDTKPALHGNGETQISAFIEQKGAQNENATVQIWEDDLLVKSENITLSQDYTRFDTQLQTTDRGFHNYVTKVISAQNEIVTENNEEAFLVDNREKTGRILYIEDLHPWEFKFIKRALDREPLIQFTSLVRTGKDFYRQGIRNKHELENGFPTTKKELYQFDALVIGSIDASAFSQQQLNLIHDFVSIRGGGLLMLGGPKSFSQGDWQTTNLADMLPVALFGEEIAVLKSQQAIYRTPFQLRLTADGYRSPMLQFFVDGKENKKAWDTLPSLLGYQLVGGAKPGATVLASHPASRDKDEHVVIASQPYGRGRTMVMASSSFWRWRMRLPSMDNRHEQFWRQIAQWLALNTPAPINIEVEKNAFALNEKVALHLTVLDSQFQVLPGAQVSVQVKQPVGHPDAGGSQGDPPVGKTLNLQPVADLNKPGHYVTEFTPHHEGFHEVEVFVHKSDGGYVGHANAGFIATDKKREFLNPAIKENYLRHMAQLAKGQYYRIDEANELPEKLAVTESSYTKIVERDLWDAPFFFLLILLFFTVEWSLRRAKGLS
ncbi:MAG: hypothetical protein DWQ10_00030 [Calditrichaeota bacterium]|nr:MAG: hypothetical protein DWQ10_00030 [Calditrichota bacterium]